MKKENSVFEFEGVKIKPSKSGTYNGCPFNCDVGTGYPIRKWKTEKGIKNHLKECCNTPTNVKVREEKTTAMANEEKKRIAELERKRADILKRIPQKVGDTIYHTYSHCVKPTHEWRGSRRVRVRYEAVYSYGWSEATIASIGFGAGTMIVFNENIAASAICATAEEAKKRSEEDQKEHDDWNKQCSSYR